MNYFCRSDPKSASGLRHILNWMNKHYPGTDMYIAGYLGRPSTGKGSLEDTENVAWYQAHINEVLKGINAILVVIKYNFVDEIHFVLCIERKRIC